MENDVGPSPRLWQIYTQSQTIPPNTYSSVSGPSASITATAPRRALMDITPRTINKDFDSSLPRSSAKRRLPSVSGGVPSTLSGRRSPEPTLKKENINRSLETTASLASKVPTRPQNKRLASPGSIPRPMSTLSNAQSRFSYAASNSPSIAISNASSNSSSDYDAGSTWHRPTTFVTPPSSLSRTCPFTDTKQNRPTFQIARMGIGEGDERSFADIFSDSWDDSSIVTGQSVIGRGSQTASSTVQPRSRIAASAVLGCGTSQSGATRRIPIPVSATTVTSRNIVLALAAPHGTTADIFDQPSYATQLDSNWTLSAATDGSGGCDSRHELANKTDSEDDYEDPFVFDSNPHLVLVACQSRSQSLSSLPHTTPPSNASFTIIAPKDLSSSPPSPPPSPPSRTSRFRSGTVHREDRPKPIARSRFSITPIEAPKPGSGGEQDTFRRFSLRRMTRVDGRTVFVQDIGDELVGDEYQEGGGGGEGGERKSVGRWRVQVDADGLPEDMLQMLDELEGFAKDLRDMNEEDLDANVSPRIAGSDLVKVETGDVMAKETMTTVPKIVVTQSFQSMTNAVELKLPDSGTSGSVGTLGSIGESYASVLEGVLELCGAYEASEDGVQEDSMASEFEGDNDEVESEDESFPIPRLDKGKWRAVEDATAVQEVQEEVILEAVASLSSEGSSLNFPSKGSFSCVYLPDFSPEFLCGSSTSLVLQEAQGYHSRPRPARPTKASTAIPTSTRRRSLKFSLSRRKTSIPTPLPQVPSILQRNNETPSGSSHVKFATSQKVAEGYGITSPPLKPVPSRINTNASSRSERNKSPFALSYVAPPVPVSAPATVSTFSSPTSSTTPVRRGRLIPSRTKTMDSAFSATSTIDSNHPLRNHTSHTPAGNSSTQWNSSPSRVPGSPQLQYATQTHLTHSNPTRLPQPAASARTVTGRFFSGIGSNSSPSSVIPAAPKSAPATATTFGYSPQAANSCAGSASNTRPPSSSGVRGFFSRRHEQRATSLSEHRPLPAPSSAASSKIGKARAMSMGAGAGGKSVSGMKAAIGSTDHDAMPGGFIGEAQTLRPGSRAGSKLPSAKELLKRFG